MRHCASPRHGLHRLVAFILLSLTTIASMPIHAAAEITDSDALSDQRWEALRAQLFQDRSISEDGGVILLDSPPRAFDAARVPVTIKAVGAQSAERYIETLYLIVDKNPLPVAATFHFEPNKGWDSVDTELRVNEYTNIRAVAELSDGSLHMQANFIKAVGGCSAPPSSYERSDGNQLGSFRGGVDLLLNPRAPAVARFRLVHPNASGMQFDQFTRTYIPAYYVHTIGVEYNGEPLFTVDANFSLSQDPVLGFNFKPEEDGELMIYALDSKNKRFENAWSLQGTTTVQ